MSVIYIRDLVIEAKHGVHPREKQEAQRFRVSVELNVDTGAAGRTDDLADTLDWSGLRRLIIETVQNNSFNLVERLAREVADQILKDKRVESLTVSIDKLDAFKDAVPGVRLAAARSDG